MLLGALLGLAVHLALSILMIAVFLVPFGMNDRVYHLAAFGWVLPATPGAALFGAVLGRRIPPGLTLRRFLAGGVLGGLNSFVVAPLVLLAAVGEHSYRMVLLGQYYVAGLITAYLLLGPLGWGTAMPLILYAAGREDRRLRATACGAAACVVLCLPMVRWPVRKQGDFATLKVNEALIRGQRAEAVQAIEAGEPVGIMDRMGSYAVIEASEMGDAAIVRALLARGASLAVTDDTKRTALHAAAERGHVEVVRILLDAGADVNAGAAKGYAPLVMAAREGHVDALRLLLARGARTDVPGATAQDLARRALDHGHKEVAAIFEGAGGALPEAETLGRGMMAALRAGDLPKAAELLRRGADPNARDVSGTALVAAIQRDERALVETLLAAGAVPNRHPPGETPALVEAVRVDPALVPLLLARGARPDDRPHPSQKTALMEAAELGDLQAVKALVAAGADLTATAERRSALERAARAGNGDVVAFLRQAGAPAEDVAVWEWRDKDARLMDAAGKGRTDEVRLWLRHGADPNHARFQPLLKAAEAGHTEVVDLLLAAGADPRATDLAGRTALELAAPHAAVAARLRKALATR
jgi:ankyrin repeat protein